jgi:DNA-binding MarR family transcriptional regulator
LIKLVNRKFGAVASGYEVAMGALKESGEIDAIARALDECYTHVGRQFGPLSRPQRRMLHLLSREDQVRVSDLAARLGLTTAGSTRMLDTLEAQGYIGRMRRPETDQREVYVSLTSAGGEALREADLVFVGRVAKLVERLSDADRIELARLLSEISYDSN